MSDDAQVTDFSEADLVDIRRFCGYPAYAGDVGLNYEADFFVLETRLGALGTVEQSVITATFLPVLRTLETALTNASANLDTDSAAVWKHNKNEVADRVGLYNIRRRELCYFIGVRPGRSIMDGTSVIRT